jgi:DNA replication and repair protein RecF
VLVRSLKLSGFRNLVPTTLEPGERFNVLAGDNGQGKTNLLEALYLVCTLRSFRTQRLAEVIRHDAEETLVGARVAREGLERTYELLLGRRPGARRVRLDGKAVRPISRYFGDFNVVLFAPEDLMVPRGSPADRRRFLDRTVFNRRAGFLLDAQAYDRALRNRNKLLRAFADGTRRPDEDLLAAHDEPLADRGARLMRGRAALVEELQPGFRAAFAAITGGALPADLAYAPSVSADGAEERLRAALLAALAAARPADRARGTTTVGPHRDDVEILLDGRPAGAFASQGQLRALVLAWKTAELDLLAAEEPPILLLDDVSSELDPTRNEYLFAFLSERASQCFITTTHPGHVLAVRNRRDYTVSGGVVRPVQ